MQSKFLSAILCWSLMMTAFAQNSSPNEKSNGDPQDDLAEIAKLHKAIETEQTKIGQRLAAESDAKSKWTTMTGEFLTFVWNDPSSFWGVMATYIAEAIAFGTVWKYKRHTVANWQHVIHSLDGIQSREFRMVRAGGDGSLVTSFKKLFQEWTIAEKELGKSLAALSREELDVWLQSDRVSSEIRKQALELSAKAGTRSSSLGELTGGIKSIPEAVNQHVGAYENIRRAIVQEQLPKDVKLLTGREITVPIEPSKLFAGGKSELMALPSGQGNTVSLGISPGRMAAQVEASLNSINNLKSSTTRSLARARRIRGFAGRAFVPAVLVMGPLVGVLIYRQSAYLQKKEMELWNNAKALKKTRDLYVHSMAKMTTQPLLSMVVASWKMDRTLGAYRCPLAVEKDPQIFNPDLKPIEGFALAALLELMSEGKEIMTDNEGMMMHFPEFLDRFYRKVIQYAKRQNVALNRIPEEVWDKEIIPDLVASGERLYGTLPIQEDPPNPDDASVPFGFEKE